MLDFQRARAAYRQAGIAGEVESLVLSLAVAYRRMGDVEQARRHFTQALERMRARGDWDGVATNLIQLGFLHEEAGTPEHALGPFQQALDVALAHDLPDTANSALLGLAEAQIGLGQSETALRTLERARQGFAARQDGSSEDSLQLLTGQALARQGRHAEALAQYRQALPLIKRNGNDRYLAQLYKAQATSLERMGHLAAALSDYKQYTELQLKLQGKMRLEQGRLLEYEYEIRRGEFENQRLRIEAASKQEQVHALERVRQWQWVTIVLGALLLALLTSLAWRHGRTSRRLSRQSLIDPLTGVANRAAIEAEAIRAIERAPRARRRGVVADARPRPLQGDQRPPWPCRRRPRAVRHDRWRGRRCCAAATRWAGSAARNSWWSARTPPWNRRSWWRNGCARPPPRCASTTSTRRCGSR